MHGASPRGNYPFCTMIVLNNKQFYPLIWKQDWWMLRKATVGAVGMFERGPTLQNRHP